MRHAFISLGSNTNVVDGPGQVYGVTVSGVNGASVYLVDSLSIGATPNYLTQISDGSNIAVIGPLTAAGGVFDLWGAPFTYGLTVAATSNASLGVVFTP